MRRLGPQLLGGNGPGKQAPGWAELRLLLERWEEIAGADYVNLTTPQTVKFKGTERRDGTLVIAAPGALRTELQHDAGIIIDRVNRLFGYRAIAQLQLIPQTSLLDDVTPTPNNPVDSSLLADIESEDLRAALAGFGASLPAPRKPQ